MENDTDVKNSQVRAWGAHAYRVSTEEHFEVTSPEGSENKFKKHIEPWLSAVFQSEHLALLLGSGFTKGVVQSAGKDAIGMGEAKWTLFGKYADSLQKAAANYAVNAGRGDCANIEDQLRAVLALIEGLGILGQTDDDANEGKEGLLKAYSRVLREFIRGVLDTEAIIARVALPKSAKEDPALIVEAIVQLQAFLLSFASRSASRERLHIFTTNYDRLIEFGADLAGLHVIDRFVGALEPRFRSSRLEIDLHYNPPGIRGEPRYMEGVVHLTKLHGSLDWRLDANGWIRRIGLPFGAREMNGNIVENTIIYPNAAKDRETTEYPYVDLFRDFAAAVCQPNSALVTYGYGFGDDHINRVIADMLTIPSSHLVIISYNDEGGRISRFCSAIGRKAQISLLIGPHFANLQNLVDHYLPKPAIDRITMRQTELLRNRNPLAMNKTQDEVLPSAAQEVPSSVQETKSIKS